jgi:opacity protein-like surface antigen
MLKYYSFIIVIILTILPCPGSANDTNNVFQPTPFDKFIERLNYSKESENQYIIGLKYGLSSLTDPHPAVFSELSDVYFLTIQYGFIRIEEEYNESSYLHLASETAFLGNYSSHMSHKSLTFPGKTTDCWRFGFNFKNGYGYNLKYGKILLLHSGDISWSKIDYENLGESGEEQNRYDVFDEKYKFGTSYGAGLKYYFFDGLAVDLAYEHSLVFPKFLGWKWFGTATTELLIQRAIDYFGEDLLDDYPKYFPVYNLIIKNAVSMIFYELRRNQMNWFFKTEPPLSYDGLYIGLNFTF